MIPWNPLRNSLLSIDGRRLLVHASRFPAPLDSGIAMPEESAEPIRAKFDYIKSPFFRTVHGDGVWGGVTPRLDIFIGIFSTRPSIPTQVSHEFTTDGELGRELLEERQGRGTIIREMEVGINVDLPTAKAMVAWLEDKISKIEAAVEKSEGDAK